MTARQVYQYLLVELNKVEAPTLLLDDFIYFLNKAIISYVDKRYALYEMNQQLTDDLGVLSATAAVTSLTLNTSSIEAATYDGVLPADYFHILDCVAQFTYQQKAGCHNINDVVTEGVHKLTSGTMSGLLKNHYLRPSYKRPYYYIHNTSTLATLTNGDRVAGDRKGFINPPKIQIRYGNDTSVVTPTKLFIDYIRVPQYMTLLQSDIDGNTDVSQIMEFPDYACYEIIKELVALLMENTSNPRLNTMLPINQTVGPPMQGQAAPPAKR